MFHHRNDARRWATSEVSTRLAGADVTIAVRLLCSLPSENEAHPRKAGVSPGHTTRYAAVVSIPASAFSSSSRPSCLTLTSTDGWQFPGPPSAFPPLVWSEVLNPCPLRERATRSISVCGWGGVSVSEAALGCVLSVGAISNTPSTTQGEKNTPEPGGGQLAGVWIFGTGYRIGEYAGRPARGANR